MPVGEDLPCLRLSLRRLDVPDMRIAHLDGSPYLSLTIPPKEPLCAVCEQPIRWFMDMFSFKPGPDRRLAHARCIMSKEAFRREERQARDPVDS